MKNQFAFSCMNKNKEIDILDGGAVSDLNRLDLVRACPDRLILGRPNILLLVDLGKPEPNLIVY